LQAAYVKLHGTETQIGDSLEMAIQKTRAWRGSIQSYHTLVQYNEVLLKTELERLNAGTVDAHRVFEVEADLLDARQNLAGALVQYRESLLQVQVTDGSILKKCNLEITSNQLRQQTDAWLGQKAALQDKSQN
jgi:outer membrane protein TolC